MFDLTRFFLLTSAVAVLAVSALVVLHRQSEVERLIEFTESRNVELALAMANTIWPRFSSYVSEATKRDTEALREGPDNRALGTEMRRISAGLPVVKVKIYNLDGLTVYSSEPAEIGENRTHHPGFRTAALVGRSASELSYRDKFRAFEGTISQRDLVESYLPIRGPGGQIEGVFELYSDVTQLLAAIQRSTTKLAAGFVVLFVLLYGALYLIVRRADRTITRQYTDITDKNAALEREVAERQKAETALQAARDGLEQRVEERTDALKTETRERRLVEDEVWRHRNLLARFGRISVMGELASSLAHELNQPLTVISGCAQICSEAVARGEAAGERLRDAIEQMSSQSQRADAILHRIRDFVRHRAPQHQRMDLNETVVGIVELLQSDAREHGAEIDIDLETDLPAIEGDPIQVQQVVLNLAHNGYEAMAELTTAKAKLSVTTARHDGGAAITVEDNGPGLPDEVMAHLFQPFFTTKESGMGMGLSICRSIIEAHGGRLWASDCKTGSGAAFHITFPSAGGDSP